MQAPDAQARMAMCSASECDVPAKPPGGPPSSLHGIALGSDTDVATNSHHGTPTGSIHDTPAGSPHRLPIGSLNGIPAGSQQDGLRAGSLSSIPASSVGSRQLSSGAFEDAKRLHSGCIAAAEMHRQLLQRQTGCGQVPGQVLGLQLSHVIGRGSFGTVYEGAAPPLRAGCM